MQYIPRQHQQKALDFLRAHRRCCLFLDMGLGKTVVTLTYIKELLDDFAVNKVLVIAPKRVAEDTWTSEKNKWDHLHELRIAKVLGTPKQRTAALSSAADIYVINRENVQWLVGHMGDSWPFDMVVIDELSSFKSSQSKRWRSLRRVIKLTSRVIGLTGTPAGNGYEDLWAEMYLIDGGEALGRTLTSYRDTYFYPGARKGHIVYEWKLKTGSKDKIDRKLRPLCLSMSKDDWLSLPPILYNEVRVKMSAEEMAEYTRFSNDRVLPLLEGKLSTVEDMESAVVGGTAAVVSGKLLQMANGAVYDDVGGVYHLHDRKLDALDDIVEAAQGQPILVYYAYKHDAWRIQERFPFARQLGGSEDIAEWNNGNIPMLLCHPSSAGLGLNLQQGGHILVWFGLPWSLELLQQAEARLHRQGQEESVIVHRIVCEETLDEKVLAVLTRKDATQRALLQALKEYVVGTWQ